MAVVAELVLPGRTSRPVLGAAAVPVGLAALAGVLLLWGRSYPGFPMAVALVALLCALAALVLVLVGASRARGVVAAVAVVAVAVTLACGVAAGTLVGLRPLQLRWSASASDFEAYVAGLPAPATFVPSLDGPAFHPFPSPAGCPARLGRVTLGECRSVDGGYLFLQAPDALTDSSGIAYLPAGNDPARTGLGTSDLTPLGGPWWSWTCHC